MQAGRHHYVPIFYQRGFAADGLLWVYDRRSKTHSNRHPKSICVAKELYTYFSLSINGDQKIETEFLSRLESNAASAIKSLSPTHSLNDESRSAISIFVACQYLRSPGQRGLVSEVGELALNNWVKGFISDRNRVSRIAKAISGSWGARKYHSPPPQQQILFTNGIWRTAICHLEAFVQRG